MWAISRAFSGKRKRVESVRDTAIWCESARVRVCVCVCVCVEKAKRTAGSTTGAR